MSRVHARNEASMERASNDNETSIKRALGKFPSAPPTLPYSSITTCDSRNRAYITILSLANSSRAAFSKLTGFAVASMYRPSASPEGRDRATAPLPRDSRSGIMSIRRKTALALKSVNFQQRNTRQPPIILVIGG